ncbi:hypothetical protein [Streptomyces aureus]
MVKALLTAMATLEAHIQVGHDSHMALSTLEGIAFELDKMDSGERQRFLDALERVASHEPDRAAWIRSLPGALGID